MQDKLNLMIPGPTPVPENVLSSMSKHPIGHRSGDFQKIVQKTTEQLKWLHQTTADVLTITGSGTAAMEAGIINTLSKGDSVICGDNGKFGERWVKVARAYGLDVKVVKADWGTPLDPNQFKRILEEDTNKKIEENLTRGIPVVSGLFGDLQIEIENIKEQIKILDVVKFVVSEEGVKSYIVRKILKLLNNKLAYYLKAMDANCICIFNEYFEEQIVDDKGKICSYFNFSGAERKNIDLACLFTFMDIRRLQGDVAFNVSMYDELFDSSLDEKGVELVVNILRERLEKYNECMMVISHRKESTKSVSYTHLTLPTKA